MTLGSGAEALRSKDDGGWFLRLWAVAVIAHILGNPRIGQVFGTPTWLGWATLLTGVIAIGVLLRPERMAWGIAMNGGVVATVWFEAPFIGNHWLLAGAVSLAWMVSRTFENPWRWFEGSARGIHVTFYAFAGFAKLNTAFFDPDVSCGMHYANQTLTSWGLPALGTGSVSAIVAIWAPALIELAIPLLLVVRRTRTIGVAIALVFHLVISLDMHQHFYDFSAVLFPLFLLWLGPGQLEVIGRGLPRRAQAILAVLIGAFLVATVVPLSNLTGVLLTKGVFLLWIPFAVSLVYFTLRRANWHGAAVAAPRGFLAWMLVALIAFNGVTPYIELKTATSWNMYSNLLTAGGESNHFIVTRTWPLTQQQSNPLEIVTTNDEGLQQYVGSGYLLPQRTLFDYLARRVDVRVQARYPDGRLEDFTSSDGVELPEIIRRFALLRAIDSERPVRCQTVWLPAR